MAGEKNVRVKTRKLTAAAVMTALAVIILFLGSVIDILDLTSVVVASISVYFALIELRGAYPWITYAAVSVLSLVLLPSKLSAVMFAVFGGIYPIAKSFFERLKAPVSWTLKVVFFNAALTAIVLISKYIVHIEEDAFAFGILTYVLGNIAFLLYDIAMSRLASYYVYVLRRKLRIDSYFGK